MKFALLRPLLTAAVSIFWTPLAAQTFPAVYTLDECMAYAVAHSPAVRRQTFVNDNYRQNYIESVAALVPSVEGSVYASTNFGRSIDPETNTYTGTSNLSNSYSVSAQLPVFQGLAGINTVRAARVMRLKGIEELQQAEDEVSLRTMQAYFDAVYYTGCVELAREQLEASEANLARSRKLYELGLKSAADLAEVESQVAADDYLLTQQENNLALARIVLAAAMNFPADEPLEIETDLTVAIPQRAATLAEVQSFAAAHHPEAVGAAYELQRSRLNLAATRGGYLPSLHLGGGYSTNFFMSLDDHSLYGSFRSQFRDNRGYFIQAQLRVPIFGGLVRRSNVRRARNGVRIALQQREEVLRALDNEVAQTYQQMLGYGKEYVQADKKSRAAGLAYEAVLGKYEKGMVSALDLRTAANNLLRARSERLRARLQYLLKSRLVEYYNGRPLIR